MYFIHDVFVQVNIFNMFWGSFSEVVNKLWFIQVFYQHYFKTYLYILYTCLLEMYYFIRRNTRKVFFYVNQFKYLRNLIKTFFLIH